MIKRFLVVLMLLGAFLIIPGVAYAAPEAPNMEAPKNLSVDLKEDSDGMPYFLLKCDVPQSVLDLHERFVNGEEAVEADGVQIMIDYKIGNGPWNEGLSIWRDRALCEANDLRIEPLDEGGFDTIDIKANQYTFRVYFEYIWGYKDDWIDKSKQSAYSNTVSLGIGSYYDNASDWAVPELDKAAKYGFITDKIKGKMNGPITREEFAEVAVRLYEKMTGTDAPYTDMSVFTDTENPEIFKAYEANIVNGVGENKYAPNNLVTREQIACMMNRAVKAVKPDADFSTAGVDKFADEHLISDWALDSLRFANKNSIIKGVGDGRIDPQGTTTREQAVIMVVRTYEKYK